MTNENNIKLTPFYASAVFLIFFGWFMGRYLNPSDMPIIKVGGYIVMLSGSALFANISVYGFVRELKRMFNTKGGV